MTLMPDIFSIKTAWRDARSQYKSLLVYCGGIVAGVAALVAILSFRSDVLMTVDEQSRELLGADLEISQGRPYSDELVAWIDSVGGDQARSIEFSSMVMYGDVTRLSQIRAIEGPFPFYGEIKTSPETAAQTYQQERKALVDRPIMEQLDLQVGDSIRLGTEWIRISGKILEVPGESAAFSLIGPRIIVPKDAVAGSRLLDRGSRVQYKTWFRFGSHSHPGVTRDGQEVRREHIPDEDEIGQMASEVREIAGDSRINVTTVASRKQDFAQIIDNLTRFLGMVGFIALMLGALGVASAVYVYIKRKSATVATLRCLGASSRQVLYIFGIQVVGLGFAGAVAGALLGLLVQRFLPLLFTDFLPFELVQQVSLPAVGLGLLTGMATSIALAVMPLMSISSIPPLLAVRITDFSPLAHVSRRVKTGIGATVILALTLILAALLQSITAAALFIAGIIASILVLLAMSSLLIRTVRSLRLRSLSYVWRQGIANMFRPNNQTSVLVTTLGMGMLLIGSMYLSQEMILQRIDFRTGEDQSNLVFYDIQSDQLDDVTDISRDEGARVLETVPIVSMRLTHRNHRPVREIRDDTTSTASSWALTREYRVTYREELNEAETIREGEWIGQSEGIGSGKPVPVSLDYRLADDLAAGLGDTLTFDIQGVPVDTRVASIREVDFQRPQPNFFVLFPAGVLESAPQFHALTLRTPDEQTGARIQQAVVQSHPNVSAIDVGLVLQSVETFLDKVAMAVQFMALFSILTGLIVLASAIAISRFQRLKESVLLRTIGATRRQILGIQFVEYLWLGALSCLTGLLLALIAGWLLALLYFDLIFVPDLWALLAASVVVIALTLIVGFLNFRGILQSKPLEVLRAEG